VVVVGKASYHLTDEALKGGDTMKNKHAKALGRLGGLATKKKYGKEHYKKLAENMNKKIKEKKEK